MAHKTPRENREMAYIKYASEIAEIHSLIEEGAKNGHISFDTNKLKKQLMYHDINGSGNVILDYFKEFGYTIKGQYICW